MSSVKVDYPLGTVGPLSSLPSAGQQAAVLSRSAASGRLIVWWLLCEGPLSQMHVPRVLEGLNPALVVDVWFIPVKSICLRLLFVKVGLSLFVLILPRLRVS